MYYSSKLMALTDPQLNRGPPIHTQIAEYKQFKFLDPTPQPLDKSTVNDILKSSRNSMVGGGLSRRGGGGSVPKFS
jgi:hypothetical protein